MGKNEHFPSFCVSCILTDVQAHSPAVSPYLRSSVSVSLSLSHTHTHTRTLSEREIYIYQFESWYCIVNKINSKWIKHLNSSARFIKFLEKKAQGETSVHWLWLWFLAYNSKSTREQRIDKLDFIKFINFCVFKEHYQYNENETHRMEENTCKSYIWSSPSRT